MNENVKILCDTLEMPVQMQEMLASFEQNFDYDTVRQELKDLTDAEKWESARISLKEKLGTDRDGIGMLSCMLHSMEYTQEYYKEKNIPQQIFTDTMKCFSRFVGEHYVSYGRYGFDRDFWTGRQLSGLLFRIGMLEYEMTQAVIPDEDGTGKAAEKRNVISVHIPSDSTLTEEKCRESIRASEAFFREFFPERSSDPYVCSSWLLSPALRELLGEGSNILRFQRMFRIVEWDQDSRGFTEWVFKHNEERQGELTPEELPEHTSLQRRMKQHLQAGGKVGEGFGILEMI